MKRCSRCKRRKSASAFCRLRTTRDGLHFNCRPCNIEVQREYRARNKNKAPPADVRFHRRIENAKRYIVTCAQSATPIHSEFVRTLKRAAEELSAELIVIPLRYRNPTQPKRWSKYGDDTWAHEVTPYLFNGRRKLHKHLTLAADVKSQPTASHPLTGFESLTGRESCIIGHPKMQFRVVAVPSERYPKILTTTGACTVRNYSDTRAGKVGEFHHYLGAILVELEGARFHIRQLNADRKTGEFIDLDRLYTAEGSRPAPPALGLVMGDTHVRVTDPKVDAATFAPGGMVDTLNPRTLVFHDLIDGESVNPHEVDDPVKTYAKKVAGRMDVRAEVVEAVQFVNQRSDNRDVVIVDSNHQDFLTRWIKRADWKRDLTNAPFYLQTAIALLASARMTPGGPEHDTAFAHWFRALGAKANVRCLKPGESFLLGNVECGMHGHQGPNGARGSLKNLSRLGTRVISGHAHTPGIEEGHYQVGTSTPRRLSYCGGPGSWLNTHCVVYANGARALISIIDGAWRLRRGAADTNARGGRRSPAARSRAPQAQTRELACA